MTRGEKLIRQVNSHHVIHINHRIYIARARVKKTADSLIFLLPTSTTPKNS